MGRDYWRSADIFVRNRACAGVGRAHSSPMPPGFDPPHAGGMAEKPNVATLGLSGVPPLKVHPSLRPVPVWGTSEVRRAEKEFTTAWDDLVRAKAWAMEVLGPLAHADVLRCCIESTCAYHMPVLRAWRAIPRVVNPLLVGHPPQD